MRDLEEEGEGSWNELCMEEKLEKRMSEIRSCCKIRAWMWRGVMSGRESVLVPAELSRI